ncbi:conserved hypothetical protein [Leishmania mexicana MHOM/GT/2001/U1103]|uniref:Uncharacterized protein n=1 Tax=Leishmania mexicana (strain MHOM/GT/2001/U1103) TaxID=929439 RepID=E9AUL3_LEIMU|nr:conserved hypothetical protein [Leishmania mexicana MHOM/GT/2001/U1103]CBZ26642.1 conserved hypothetical protein [Leishmania mexicana MHOM/GT/2001/U1103]
MGATPSREAKPTIRSLRYGNHEIGLIPITRAYFNDQNPQLRQQFIRVRNDPNVRYSHTRPRGFSMAEVPPANYTEADLEAFLSTVERSLFDTNEEMLDAGALQTPTISMAHLQHLMQCDGEVDVYDPTLEKEVEGSDKSSQPPTSVEPFFLGAIGTPSLPPHNRVNSGHATSPQNPYPARETTSWLRSTSLSLRASSSDEAGNSPAHSTSAVSATLSLNATASHMLLPPTTPTAPPQDEKTLKMPSAEDCATDWFLRLKGFLQAHHRHADESCSPSDSDTHHRHEQSPCPSQFFKSEEYMRFKRAVQPVPCAVLFIYVSNREEHDCFTFQGHRVNVIGSFDMRSHDDDRDTFTPTLQIRKAILKAAGDRTLERVLALSTKYYLDSFTEIVLQQLQRRPVAELLAGLGEEARNLLCELPTSPLVGGTDGGSSMYDPVSVARALFYERITKLPLVVSSPFNNYPALKFIYDFTSLTHSIENSQFVRSGDLRLCTYDREKGERGIVFLFHGRALALTWLWATTQTQTSTVRESWTQYTLCEHTQSRERRVQHWLATDPRAKTLLGDSAITTCFEQHLGHLHSEIVRARSTPTDDATSWSDVQEYSHDMKLYRIFLSPLCGPLLTTVKTAKPEKVKERGSVKKASTPSSTPSTADGGNASTGSRGRTTSDLRLMMMSPPGNALPANNRSCVQAHGKKSPNSPLKGLSTSERTPSTSNFSTSAATLGGGSSSSSAPLGMSSTANSTFLHAPQHAPSSLNGDGATRMTMPSSFMVPAPFTSQAAPISGMHGPMPIYFTDPLQQPQLQPPSMMPPSNSPQPSQSMVTSPSQPPTAVSTAYVIQVSSNGVQTLMPITFAPTPSSAIPSVSFFQADSSKTSNANAPNAGASVLGGASSPYPHPAHNLDGATAMPYPNMMVTFATGYGGAPMATMPYQMAPLHSTSPMLATMHQAPAQLVSDSTACLATPKAYIPVGYFSTSVPGPASMPH